LRRWPGTAFWALLLATSIVLIVMGLWRTTFFIYGPEPALEEKARVGALYVLSGSVMSLCAAGSLDRHQLPRRQSRESGVLT
jgi:hypothetical protein